MKYDEHDTKACCCFRLRSDGSLGLGGTPLGSSSWYDAFHRASLARHVTSYSKVFSVSGIQTLFNVASRLWRFITGESCRLELISNFVSVDQYVRECLSGYVWVFFCNIIIHWELEAKHNLLHRQCFPPNVNGWLKSSKQ